MSSRYTYSDLYLKTCVPCLTFAGAILTIQMTKLLCPVGFTSMFINELIFCYDEFYLLACTISIVDNEHC
jgi:hypothetical protein